MTGLGPNCCYLKLGKFGFPDFRFKFLYNLPVSPFPGKMLRNDAINSKTFFILPVIQLALEVQLKKKNVPAFANIPYEYEL